MEDITAAVAELPRWPEGTSEYRQLRAAALLWERRLVEFLLPPKGDPNDALRTTDFDVDLHLSSSQIKSLTDRKRKLNDNIAHLNWTEIDSPRRWRIARIRITLEVLGDFADRLPNQFAQGKDRLRSTISLGKDRIASIDPERTF